MHGSKLRVPISIGAGLLAGLLTITLVGFAIIAGTYIWFINSDFTW